MWLKTSASRDVQRIRDKMVGTL